MDHHTKDITVLHEGHHLRLCTRGTWEFAQRLTTSRAVVLVAITQDEELLLVEQFRPPVGANVIELPAGLVGDEDSEESALEAASRELEEETGYQAKQMKRITAGPPAPGTTDEVAEFVLATGLTRVGQGGGVGNEDITVHHIPLAQAQEDLIRLSETKVVDPKVFCGVLFAQTRKESKR